MASRPDGRGRASGAHSSVASIRVLGALQLNIGGRAIELSATSRRVLSYLALAGRPSSRSELAGSLWPEIAEERSLARLRTSLWRLERVGLRLTRLDGNRLALGADVLVDLCELRGVALAMLRGAGDLPDRAVDDLSAAPPVLLESDDDWVLLERERFRLLRMHALETAAERLCSAGRYGLAIDLAVQLISDDPLRETAHRLLIRCHLAAGNRNEALRQFERYRRLLAEDLDLDPPDDIKRLVSRQQRVGAGSAPTTESGTAVRGGPRRDLISLGSVNR